MLHDASIFSLIFIAQVLSFLFLHNLLSNDAGLIVFRTDLST